MPLQNLERACYFDKESGLFFLILNISKIYVSHEPNWKVCSVARRYRSDSINTKIGLFTRQNISKCIVVECSGLAQKSVTSSLKLLEKHQKKVRFILGSCILGTVFYLLLTLCWKIRNTKYFTHSMKFINTLQFILVAEAIIQPIRLEQ